MADERRVTGRRRGFSMVEMEVAFAAFGVILAGLCPVVVAQLKHVKRLEARFQPDRTYYLIPRAEPWARKLAGTPTIADEAPVGPSSTAPPAANEVSVISLTAGPAADDFTAAVRVQAVVP